LDNYVLYYDETTKRIKKKTSDLQEVDKNLSLNSKLIISTDSYIRLTKENIENFEIKKKEEIQTLTLEIEELNTDLLELQEIEKIYVNVNDLELNQIKKDISVVENEIQKLTTELNHQVKLLTNSKNSKEAEINAKAKELIAKENLERSEFISKSNNEANSKISELQAELNGLLNSIENNKIKTENNNKQIKSDNEKIDKLFDSLNQEKPVCPTCGKPLTDETVNKHLKEELNDLYITRDAAVNSNIKLEEFNKKYSKVIKDLRESINKCTNECELNLVAADGQCNEQIHIINERLISSLETLESSFNKKMDSIELEFDEKSHEFQDKLLDLQSEQQKLEMLFDEKNRLSEKISEAKRNIASKQSDIRTKESQKYNEGMLEHYIEEMTRLEEEKRILASSKTELNDSIEMLEFWKDGFSSTGIPSLLIDEAIPFLNSAVAEYLEKIGGRYVASFDTLSTTKAGEYRDKINVNVLDTKTKANNRKQLSGGQTRVIDIAILLSLCDLQNNVQDMKTNILLLDEIFDSLDDQNISYVSSLLRTLAKGKAINLISHRHIDSIEADEVIRLF
jgi:DNA repair exonuclease SbcCD ATPase subunit